MKRSAQNVWLHRFAMLLALATLFLVALGGVVTSKGVGMSVPDWPNTYGENMFLFPYSKWVGGVFYEHSHRLVATAVGFLTTILTIWIWLVDSRPLLRGLGVAALVGVVFQGVLGGLRVVLDSHGLGVELGIFHAAFAQLFFVLIGSIALLTSRWWTESGRATVALANANRAQQELRPTFRLRRFLLLTTVLIFIQLILGAAMRHQHAGLAVPDFPLAYGKLWPATDAAAIAHCNQQRMETNGEEPITAAHVIVHMLHRTTAVAILATILVAAIWIWKRSDSPRFLRHLAATWVGLVLIQVTLGAFTIWSERKVDVTTAHVAVGALTFLVGWLSFVASLRFGAESCSAAAQPILEQGDELKQA